MRRKEEVFDSLLFQNSCLVCKYESVKLGNLFYLIQALHVKADFYRAIDLDSHKIKWQYRFYLVLEKLNIRLNGNSSSSDSFSLNTFFRSMIR
jgi:hypothetical protein